GAYKIAVKTTTQLTVGSVRHHRVSVSARVVPAEPLGTTAGALKVTFDRYDARRHRWVHAGRFSRNARRTVRISYRVAPGRWRVSATYSPRKGAPFRASHARAPIRAR